MQPVLRWLWLVLVSLVLVACSTMNKTATADNQSSTKSPGAVAKLSERIQHDGSDRLLTNLDLVPSEIPQQEPLIPSANRSYSVSGQSFTPVKSAASYRKTGQASWYGKGFHGRKTSSGERYDMYAMTAAHPTLPIPSYARVTNLRNGKTVIVRINDRGPFIRSRLIDLSFAAADRLDFVHSGSTKVEIERVWPVAEGQAVTTRSPSEAREKAADPVFLQLGAHGKLASAEAQQQSLLKKLPDEHDAKLGIVNREGVYRVRLGPFENGQAARQAANTIGVQPVILR